MTNPHLKIQHPKHCVKKHFIKWIPSNKFMLQIKHHCHKPFEFHQIREDIEDNGQTWTEIHTTKTWEGR